MPEFKALSYGDKLRIGKYLRRGEAPADPRMAAATVELAESYQRQSRAMAAAIRWGPALLALCWASMTIASAVEEDQLMLTLRALVFLGWACFFIFSPATWPKHMARSLEASRRVAAGG